VLASVLAYAALKGKLYFGALLLFAYGLGAGIPLLVAASVSGQFAHRLDLSGYRQWVDRATGSLLLALGFYLLWVA
jgi:cytochrome c biogenesis protein CcdA